MTNDIKIKPINRTKQNRNEDGVQGGATLWKLLIELSRIEIMRNDPEDGVQGGY